MSRLRDGGDFRQWMLRRLQDGRADSLHVWRVVIKGCAVSTMIDDRLDMFDVEIKWSIQSDVENALILRYKILTL